MYIYVFEWARTCVECQKGNLGSAQAPMKSLQIEATIFSRWHIDHTCIRRSGEYNYVLVAIDSFSLYPLLLPARTTSADETADLLYNHLFMVLTRRNIIMRIFVVYIVQFVIYFSGFLMLQRAVDYDVCSSKPKRHGALLH